MNLWFLQLETNIMAWYVVTINFTSLVKACLMGCCSKLSSSRAAYSSEVLCHVQQLCMTCLSLLTTLGSSCQPHSSSSAVFCGISGAAFRALLAVLLLPTFGGLQDVFFLASSYCCNARDLWD